MYWVNNQVNADNIAKGDVIQWWSKLNTQFPMSDDKKIIISHQNLYYIDTGAGNKEGTKYTYGKYFTWLDLWDTNLEQNIELFDYKENVLGA